MGDTNKQHFNDDFALDKVWRTLLSQFIESYPPIRSGYHISPCGRETAKFVSSPALRGWRFGLVVGGNSAFHPYGVDKSSTNLSGWGEGGAVTSVGWQITLCDPIDKCLSGVP